MYNLAHVNDDAARNTAEGSISRRWEVEEGGRRIVCSYEGDT